MELQPVRTLTEIGQIANSYAAQNVLEEYQQRRAKNTLHRQKDDLASFAQYLREAQTSIHADALFSDIESWRGVTFGLVDGFVRYMLQKGYSIGSINVRLSTIKVYCRLATKAGVIGSTENALIRLIEGYQHKEGRNIDRTREIHRIGEKKETPVSISREQAQHLKTQQPDTLQGRRDRMLLCLLLDHGLRCGEIAALPVQAINLSDGTLSFYREKVDMVQVHELTKDSLLAAMRYVETCKPHEFLLLGSRKGGHLQGRMTQRAITARVCYLGKRVGLVGLSAHDCRHYWATSAIRGGTDIKSLQDAGGWASPAMPLRYAESSTIANKGVKLG